MLYGHLPSVIGVVGAGQMGSGIAQVCATKGLDVLINDRSQDLLDRSIQSIRKSLQRLTQKGSMDKTTAEEALGRIKTETNLDVSLVAHCRWQQQHGTQCCGCERAASMWCTAVCVCAITDQVLFGASWMCRA